MKIAVVKHWLWRAVDQTGHVLDTLVQSRRDAQAAKRLLRKLLKRQCRAQRFLSAHDGISNLFHLRRDHLPAALYRAARTQAFQTWAEVTGVAARG